MNDPNEFGPPEPILNLRKKSVMRMLQKFDSSGEDNDRGTKRRHSDSVDADEEMTEEERINREAKKAAVMDEDPPARERPADGKWPNREALSFTRSLIFYGSGSVTPEHEIAAKYIEEARAMRKKYQGSRGTKNMLGKEKSVIFVDINGKPKAKESGNKNADFNVAEDAKLGARKGAVRTDASFSKPPSDKPSCRLEYVFGLNGVVEIYDASDFRRTNNLVAVPPLSSFVEDYQRLVEMTSSGAMRSFSFQRLQMLSSAFKMHITINGAAEDEAQSGLLGTDFYRTMKVDNHIHLAAAASAKQFVNFVRDKLENEGEVVVTEDGETLKQVFEKAGLDSNHLTIDAFNVLADYSVYQRFDNFNSKYSPFRMAQMRKIFLKVDNHIDGR
mmetsp:Transcript_20991/g.44461  ORF Transcript_20991/g.44461 Transcript_20991/m.44461 type:complete len:387 (-) Transcript_20991:2453-3613(-)